MKYLVFVAYYLWAGFLLYGLYHVIFVLDKSAWWILLLTLLSISPTMSSKSDKINNV